MTATLDPIDELFGAIIAEGKSAGAAVAIVETGRQPVLRAYGLADIKLGRPMTCETGFVIGSITKNMTAVVMQILAAEGRLDLDAPISRYLDWYEQPAPTSRALLAHTSGLPRSRDDLLSVWHEARWAMEARRETLAPRVMAYSNVGYALLSLVIETVEGRPLTSVFTERLFRPLAMRDSLAGPTDVDRQKLACGYEASVSDRPVIPTDPLVEVRFMNYVNAAVSAVSSARDMAAYMQMLLADGRSASGTQVAPAGLLEQLLDGHSYRTETERYGLGTSRWSIGGREIIGHGGWTMGFRCRMLIDRASGTGVTVLSNSHAPFSFNPTTVAEAVLRDRLGLPKADAPSSPPFDPTGVFRGADGRTLSITAASDDLYVEMDGQRAPLYRVSSPEPVFATRAASLDLHPLRFQPGDRACFTYGPDRFATLAPPAHPDAPDGYCGHYRSQGDICYPSMRIYRRDGRLWITRLLTQESELVPIGPHRFEARPSYYEGRETYEFGSFAGSLATQVSRDGEAYHRQSVP